MTDFDKCACTRHDIFSVSLFCLKCIVALIVALDTYFNLFLLLLFNFDGIFARSHLLSL